MIPSGINLLEREAIDMQEQLADTQKQLSESQQTAQRLTAELQEAKLAFLGARDSAIGSAAELGELRFLLAEATTEIESLANQLEILHSSRTWRAGRFLLLPLRAIRKIVRTLSN